MRLTYFKSFLIEPMNGETSCQTRTGRRFADPTAIQFHTAPLEEPFAIERSGYWMTGLSLSTVNVLRVVKASKTEESWQDHLEAIWRIEAVDCVAEGIWNDFVFESTSEGCCQRMFAKWASVWVVVINSVETMALIVKYLNNSTSSSIKY